MSAEQVPAVGPGRKTLNTKVLGAAVTAACCGTAMAAPAAMASGTLYCSGYRSNGTGCGRNWYGHRIFTNSARNENGGTVFIQALYGGGWGARHYGFGGAVVGSHLSSPAKERTGSHPFGECVLASAVNLLQSIHCRWLSSGV